MTIQPQENTHSYRKATGTTRWLGVLLCCLFAWLPLSLSFGASASWSYATATGTLGSTYSWIDCSTGSSITSGDNVAANVAWPFKFNFYDDQYTTSNNLSVCTNGFIRLDGTANTTASAASGYQLQTSTALGQIIALGVYDDKVGDNGGWVKSLVTGTAPNRIFTIEYHQLEINNTANRYADIQVSFYETSEKVVLKFGSENINQSGVDMGIHSGMAGFFNYWKDVDGASAGWIEYTPKHVLVTATSGSTNIRYTTLKEAFNAINNGTHKGQVSVQLTGNTYETATAALNASGSGGADFTAVNIYPSVSGAIVYGTVDGPLINLNGADGVTLDGRVNATGSNADLTITNANTGSGAVTVQLDNAAQSNTLQYCNLLGGGGSSSNGTVNFGTSGTNSSNTVSYCNITNNGTRRENAFYVSSGANTGNTLSYSNLYDNWSTSANSSAVKLVWGSSDWTFSGNSIYETTAFAPSGTYAYYGFYIDHSAGSNYVLSGNYIGGKQAQCGGTALTMGTSNLQSLTLCPIYLNVGTTPSSVQGNVIQNITYRSSSATPFFGIQVAAGSVNIGNVTGNAIGDTTGTGSLTLTTTASGAISYGIKLSTSAAVTVSNNRIGAITLANSNSANGHSFYGIHKSWGSADFSVSSNTIGSQSVASSIQSTSASSSNEQYLVGIYSESIGTSLYEGNVVANLRNNTTRDNISNYVYGICLSGAATNTVSRNFITNLSCSSAGTNNVVAGFCTLANAGTVTVFNNVIALGSGLDNALFSINGILNYSGSTEYYYHNTVSLSGTVSGSTTTNTAAFAKNGWVTGITLKNNLFINTRSGGSGTGKHAAVILNNKSITSDYNDLYAPGTNGVVGVEISTPYSSLAAWYTATLLDVNGNGEDPAFANAGGTYPLAYYPRSNLFGTDLRTAVPTDFSGNSRNESSTMGAWERPIQYNVEVYNGASLLHSYFSIKDAFDAINSGAHTGELTIKLAGSVKEKAQAVLNASGTGSANYSSVLIFPSVAGVTVSGSVNGALLYLNGADRVTIDGRVNGAGTTPDLLVINKSVEAQSVTIGLDNAAQSNTIQYCVIQGGGGSSTNATVLFGETGSNSNNTLDHCWITQNGTVRQYAVLSGTGANLNGTISNNRFYDTWSATVGSSTISLGAGATGWTISGNSIYQTTALSQGAYTYCGISINSPTGTGFTVSNNSIGGNAPLCSGSLVLSGTGSTVFYPIYLNVGTSVVSTISGNTVKNLNYYSTATMPFSAIYVAGGATLIRSNTVGEATGTGSITLTNSYTEATSYGIYVAGTGNAELTGNSIGSITTANNAPASPHNFCGIYKANAAGYFIVRSNTIGSESTANSLSTSPASTSYGQTLYGIYSQGTGMVVISGNTIANLYNGTTNTNTYFKGSVVGIYTTAGTDSVYANTVRNLSISNANNASNHTASVIGISITSSTANILYGNAIYALSNAYSAFAGGVIGLYYAGGTAGTNTVFNNFIRTLSTSSASGSIYGIKMASGATTYYNNIIALTNAVSSPIYGIFETGASGNNTNLYFNTVYVYGTLGSGANNTYGLYSEVSTNTRVFENNLLANMRSGGGKHYAISLAGNSGLTINFNNYYTSGTNGFLGYLGSDKTTLDTWKSATTQDLYSLNTNPTFVNQGGSFLLPNDLMTDITLAGTPVSGISTDYLSISRSAVSPTIGAFQYFANIDVFSGTTLRASFKTLQLAFNAISYGSNSCTGNLTIKVNRNTTETSSATLNASGVNGANYTSVVIYPTSTNLTISGSFGSALINLNGAKKVCFDGRLNGVGTTSNLSLVSTNTTATAVTIQFDATAQNDTIRYCTIKGGGGSASNGTILFGIAAGTNSGDVVDHCAITNNGTRRANAIYAATATNTGIKVSNNILYDTWSTSIGSNFINLGTGASTWDISGNSFYETTSLQPAGDYAYTAINLNNASGNGFTVSNNNIGGQGALCAGSALTLGVDGTIRSLTFYPIYSNTGTSTATSIQGNVIRNINYRSSNAAPFAGIYVNGGLTTIGTTSGNIIGDATGTGSIQLMGTATTATSYGVYLGSSVNLAVSNNLIGSITTSSSDARYAHGFHAISKSATAGNTIISGNVIGSEVTAENIQTSSTATDNSQVLFGIYSAGTGTTIVANNVIAHLYNSTTESSMSSKMYGIYLLGGTNRVLNNTVHDITTGGAANGANYDNVCMTGIVNSSLAGYQTLSNNTVYNLMNTSTQKVEFYGIFMKPTTSGNDTISGNFIHGFKMASQNTTCYLHGISFVNDPGTFSGTLSVFNNIIFLGDSISTGCNIFGMLKNTVKATTIYHNTIHLGGTVGITSTVSSYAIRERSDGTLGLRNIRNNIFYNTRSGGGTNYALYFQVITNLTIDYNDYGWSGSYFAELNNQAPSLVLYPQWLTAMAGQDTHSVIIDPEFVNMGGVLATDYKTNVGLDGIAGTGVVTDFSGNTRSLGNPTMGAWECYSVDVYNGATFRSSYSTLKGAFDAINAGTWKGDLTIKLKGSTLEAATAVLNASGTGSASYSQVTIRPTRSNVVITGNLNDDVIRLNAADNVVIDGRIEGDATTINLTIINASTGAAANTVKFVESASNNVLRYCNVKGAGSGSASGVVNFSTASAGNGNDNNQIANCLITGTTTNRPVNAVYALGTVGRENSGNSLTGNSFENNWISSSDANSIRLDAGNTAWTISGNSFYHSTAFTPSGGYTYSFVNLNAGVHTITDNYFGGSAAQCLGSAMQVGSTSQAALFCPIILNVSSTGSATSVQGNTIGNLAVSSSAPIPFGVLYVIGGKVNVGTVSPNQIGASTGNSNILITTNTANATSYGFYLAGSDSIQVANNTFGSITATNAVTANAHNFTVLYATGSATVRLFSNTIGSVTTSGSIQTAGASTGATQWLRGIHYDGTGSLLVQQNTVCNLTNNSSHDDAGNRVTGIHKAGTGTGRIVQNFISGLTSVATGVSPILEGINLDNGSTVCANNVLSVGATSLGYLNVFGVQETGVGAYVDSICHNTVYVSGTVSGTTLKALSYAFYKATTNGSSIILNNIFYTIRASGRNNSRHYGMYLLSVSSVPVLNGNDYFVSGTYSRVGNVNATDYSTLADWKTAAATGKEANGTDVDPKLVNAGGTSAKDYLINAVLSGVPSTIRTDYSGNTRSLTAPTIGAFEFALCVEIYNGAVFRSAYTTLKTAFDAINAGTWTGNLTVKIVKSTYETSTASLSASGSGPTYSRVLIYPTSSGVTVTGSINGPIVRFSGADNVTLDGRVNCAGTSADLLLSNSNSGTSASTVQFIGAAQGDTVQYCIIKGAGLGTAAGTIHFSTATAAPGNSNNVIRYCRISGLSLTERPVNALLSSGTSGYSNTNNQITGNQFFNTLSPTTSSNVIYLSDYSSAFTLSNNSLYETTTFSPTAANEYALIRISSAAGVQFNITGNYLGGSGALANGTWVKVGTGATFYGMYLNVGTATATSVQGNVLKNLNYSNVGNNPFTGIYVAGGLVNIGTQNGNIIGATTGNASILLTNSTTDGSVYGIALAGTGAVECSNNSIGAITTANTSSANATNLYGIYKGAAVGNVTLRKNVIGSLVTPNSLYASSDAYLASQLVYGVYSIGTATTVIDSDSIVNVTNKTIETIQSSKTVGVYVGDGTNTVSNNVIAAISSSGAASGANGENAPNLGLLVKSTLTGQLVFGNTISRIRNTTTARVYLYGLYYSGPTTGTNQLYNNFVNRMLLPAAPPESFVNGFYLAQGAASVYNNLIAIGDSLTQGLTVYGLYNNSASTLTLYYNTLYIGGTVSAALSSTYAYLDNVTGSHNLRNNLLANMRSGGGKHYAISLAGIAGSTTNFNDYYAGGTNGILGYLGSDRTTLAAWKTATSQDGSSLNVNPLFIVPGSTQPADYTPTASLTVANVLPIAVDYAGTTRKNPPTVGAFEFNGYFWTGTIDTDWSKSGNWLPNIVPTIGVGANIPNRVNKPVINNGVNGQVNTLTIYTGAVVTIDPGGTLTVASTVTNNAGSGGLLINSTEQGTGSLICPQDGLVATVRRYIRRQHGRDQSWFTLSSPVANQTIRGTSWTPTGGYADGTGYDLFVWDEGTSAWIYNLNDTTTIDKKWSVAHPESYFVPGRGYLYSLYDSISTKTFVGTLNNGIIQTPLTISGSGSNKGFHLVGNPYPSSMDWKSATGFDRTKLTVSGGGYDLWMWSSTANNYGVYNSSQVGDVGTNNASRYISPMQGFFVNASQAGNLVFNNDARVHNAAGAWLRSAEAEVGLIRLKVSAASGNGSDEVLLRFGAESDDTGSAKLFSPVKVAPSLYMPVKNKDLSIRQLSTVENNTTTSVSFKPGTADTYTLTCEFDEALIDTLYLEDKLTGVIHNFAESGTYTFSGAPGDATSRFVLHYGAIPLNPGLVSYRVYVLDENVVVDLENVSGEYSISLFDVSGKLQQHRTVFGGSSTKLPLRERGVYIVSIHSESGIYNTKVVY